VATISTAVQTIQAGPGEVFAAWTPPEFMTRWAVDEFNNELRAGGHYRQLLRSPSGEHVVTGEYREFVPGQRLVMTWGYEGPESGDRSESFQTVQLDEPKQGTTDVRVTEEPVPKQEAREAERVWSQALAALRSLLEGTSDG